jgi:phage recombination protein Bet
MTAIQRHDIGAADIATLEQAGIIPNGTPKAQIQVFAHVCRERGLSPFSKEIYLVGYGGKYSTIVGINGLRKIAADTGHHAGTDDVKFDLQADGTFKTPAQYTKGQVPQTATSTVYRIVGGQRVAFTHTAVFAEFAGSGKWQTMPFQMIGKVAEAFALRKAFADRVTGLDIEEEQAAYADTQISATPRTDDPIKMERAKDRINMLIEQATGMDDATEAYVREALRNCRTMAHYTELAETVKNYMPEPSDPALQNKARAASNSYK